MASEQGGVERRRIGVIGIDSGLVAIGDPAYVGRKPEFCIYARTGWGDGLYPVYEETEPDGTRAAIYIDFREAAPLDGPNLDERIEGFPRVAE